MFRAQRNSTITAWEIDDTTKLQINHQTLVASMGRAEMSVLPDQRLLNYLAKKIESQS